MDAGWLSKPSGPSLSRLPAPPSIAFSVKARQIGPIAESGRSRSDALRQRGQNERPEGTGTGDRQAIRKSLMGSNRRQAPRSCRPAFRQCCRADHASTIVRRRDPQRFFNRSCPTMAASGWGIPDDSCDEDGQARLARALPLAKVRGWLCSLPVHQKRLSGLATDGRRASPRRGG
jgi:hypothetical protein